MKIRCAIYARHSPGANQRQTSVEDQISICRDFAASQGWLVLDNHIYSDKAISGISAAPRDEFLKLMEIAASGQAPFTYVLVDSTSRVARNPLDAIRTFARLKSKNIYVYYVSQGIDTALKTATPLIAINSIVDSMFIENLAAGTHRGLKGAFERGFSTGSKRLGLRSEPIFTGKKDIHGIDEIAGYKLIVDPDEKKQLIDIFSLYGYKEYSPQQIARVLNKKLKDTGYPKPPRGEAWMGSTIWRLLQNEIYRGLFVWNKTKIEINLETGAKKVIRNPPEKWLKRHDPELQIIDDALWERCQKRLNNVKDNNAERFNKGRVTIHSQHLLARVAKCNCGSTYGIVSGGTFAKYGCTRSHKYGNAFCANSIKVKKDFLEEVVLNTLCSHISKRNTLEGQLMELHNNLKEYIATHQSNKTHIELQNDLNRLDSEIKNMISEIKAGNTSLMLRQELATCENTRKELLNKINLKASEVTISDIANLVSYDDLEEHFSEVVSGLINPETTTAVFYETVESITVERNEFCIDLNIVEKLDVTAGFVFDLIAKRDARIRLQTGSRFIPYTSRIFKARILLTLDKVSCEYSDEPLTNIFILRSNR